MYVCMYGEVPKIVNVADRRYEPPLPMRYDDDECQ